MNFSGAFSVKHRLNLYLVFWLIFIIAFIAISSGMKLNNQSGKQADKIQQKINSNSILLANKAQEVAEILSNNPSNNWPLIERSINPKHIIAQIYSNDSLIFWNSRKISNSIYSLQLKNKDTIIEESTGWFMLNKSRESNYTIFLLKQIKSQYEIENNLLPISFGDEFRITSNIQLTSYLSDAQYIIKDIDGNASIGINFDSNTPLNSSQLIILFGLYLLIYIVTILIFNCLYETIKNVIKSRTALFIFFSIDLIILRLLDFYFEIPFILKNSFLFVAQANEIAGFSTVGDMFLNSLIILAIALKLFLITNDKESIKSIKNRLIKIGLILLVGILTTLSSIVIYLFVNALKYHSLLGIQFNDIHGYAALWVVLILNVSLFLIYISSQRVLSVSKVSLTFTLIILLIFSGISLVIYNQWSYIILISSALMLFAFAIIHFPSSKQDVRIIKFISLVILFSVSSALVINKAEKDSRDSHQKEMAQLFSKPDDTDLEKTFLNNYETIVNDSLVNKIIKTEIDTENKLKEYLLKTYFYNYSSKFNIQITLCDKSEYLELKPEGIIIGCDDYFKELVQESTSVGVDSTLFILERRPDRIHYLGKIPVLTEDSTKLVKTIYLQFLFNYVPEGLGYPELLVNNRMTELDLTGYSYAIYKDNQLDYKFGSFAYYTNYSYLSSYLNGEFFNLMNFRHFKLEFEPNHYIVLSRPIATISERLVTFSGLFLCIIIITFIVLLFSFRRNNHFQFGLSFRNRLQILFVTTISVVIALLALITLFYIKSNNESKIHEQLNEKTYSVIIELDHKLGGASSLREFDQDYLHDMLRKFSLVFFSDINLYDANGQIIASSRSEIFNKGLLSENINPMAYEELIVKNKLNYTTIESIGSATYYSSYAPFYLNTDQPAGIVNLPYFARQTEVRQAYYLMFFTFINLFVIFGIIGAFVAIILSRIMAKPLFLLQESIGNLRIDKENERIEWKRDDEIGELISEYNLMVDKLEQSAELLKHSERESAWRGVAQQIAHEIKNPLTPMKLNVQYLEKAYDAKDPGFDEKIKSISESLITQIDSLDKVAEMFSDFAKSNAGNFEKVDLVKLIQASVLLFSSHSKITFNFTIDDEGEEYFTPAIEKDLLRVFNNLIKNAVQAIDANPSGIIEIKISKQSNFNVVQISDNGKGIPVEARANIFQPYFTTKSGGTGLGLAIVKNIMTEIGGEINFEPVEKGGTVFNLKFKIY